MSETAAFPSDLSVIRTRSKSIMIREVNSGRDEFEVTPVWDDRSGVCNLIMGGSVCEFWQVSKRALEWLVFHDDQPTGEWSLTYIIPKNSPHRCRVRKPDCNRISATVRKFFVIFFKVMAREPRSFIVVLAGLAVTPERRSPCLDTLVLECLEADGHGLHQGFDRARGFSRANKRLRIFSEVC